MPKPKLYLWTCPEGLHPGVRAPPRLRSVDIRRYCLPCSQSTGKLVERACPARDKKRASKKDAAKTKRQRKADAKRIRELSRFTFEGVDLRKELARLASLKCLPARTRKRAPELRVRWSESHPTRLGVCWPWKRVLQVTIYPGASLGSILGTLAHELAHQVDYDRNGGQTTDNGRAIWHGDSFHSALGEIMADGYGHTEYKGGSRCVGYVPGEIAVERSKGSRVSDEDAARIKPPRASKPEVPTLRITGRVADSLECRLDTWQDSDSEWRVEAYKHLTGDDYIRRSRIRVPDLETAVAVMELISDASNDTWEVSYRTWERLEREAAEIHKALREQAEPDWKDVFAELEATHKAVHRERAGQCSMWTGNGISDWKVVVRTKDRNPKHDPKVDFMDDGWEPEYVQTSIVDKTFASLDEVRELVTSLAPRRQAAGRK